MDSDRIILELRKNRKVDPWSELALASIYNETTDVCIIKPKTLFSIGRNGDLDTGAFETIWGVGGNETYLTTNTIDRIVSTSLLDVYVIKVEGHTVTGIGVNAQFTFVVQEVTLNGQTDVSLTTPLARVSRIYNNNGTNLVGAISVFDTTGSSVAGVVSPTSAIHITIVAGEQESEKGATTFSNSDYGIITSISGGNSSRSTALLDFALEVREVGKVFRSIYHWGVSTGSVTINLNPYIVIRKNSDIRIVARTNTNNTEAFSAFNCIFGLVQI